MAKRKRAPANTHSKAHEVVQDSPFLKLPGEIRNSIYEFAVQSTRQISIRHTSICYQPPLSLVCQQIRGEYEDIYISEAAKYASTVYIFITNFIWNTRKVNILETVACLPAPISGVKRKFHFHILLTNTWDAHRNQIGELYWAWRSQPLGSFGVDFYWDSNHFDEDLWRRSHRLHSVHYLTYRVFKLPLQDAFEYYEEQRAIGKETSGRWKRQNAMDVAESAPKKQRIN